jgi:hypothetical protein
MHFEELLTALGARNQFGTISSALKQNSLAHMVSTGWVGTSLRLDTAASSPEKKQALRETLEAIYMDNMLFAQKAVVLWQLETAVAQNLADALPGFVDAASPYAPAYPGAMTQEALRDITALGIPTGYHQTDATHTVVFASKREKVEEEALPADKVPDDWKDAGFTQFFGKKKKVFQVFDSFSVNPSLGLVELRIDQAKYLSEKDILQYKTALAERFNKLAKEALGIERVLGDAVNLAPALVPLYQGKDWVVHNISHQNDAGYNNTNRGKFRNDDVRKDVYHSEGEAAVGTIQLWQCSVSFKSEFSPYSPVLVVEGHSSMLNSLVPFMDICRILDCSTEREYSRAFSALISCLGLSTQHGRTAT